MGKNDKWRRGAMHKKKRGKKNDPRKKENLLSRSGDAGRIGDIRGEGKELAGEAGNEYIPWIR